MSDNMKAIEGKEGVFAIMETSRGDIVLQLYYDKTPLTVTNFVGLAEGTLDAAKGKPFYDGLKFHRVIKDFMIQGGDPRGNGTGGPGYKFDDEFVEGLIFDKPGKLAMANSGANTNGSQFFITHVPTDWLNYKHTIFGEVLKGQDVVDSVKQDDKIEKVTIIRQGEDAKNFKATQADFDRLVPQVKAANEEKAKAKIAKVIEDCNKTSTGIYFKTLKKGNGKKPSAGTKVTVEYIGMLVDGQIFDASKGFHPQGHEPLSFTAGAGEMIPGFDQMVLDMEYGEKRHTVLPPDLAYGSRGIPQAGIPGDAYLVFDIELVK
ncbi:MAG: peptidylprolyl isomerase [Treponemataceae bacterium]|nr:peptidylprolyl isomerase [Treponemataceae bacterium]